MDEPADGGQAAEMSYWDFGYGVDVYDHNRRRSALVFLPDSAVEWLGRLDGAPGHAALDYGETAQPRFHVLSEPMTFGAAKERLGDLLRGCRGPNVPAHRQSRVADADVIRSKLSIN